MEIDKEKFDKLKQLDRIEFRQKKEIIKSWKEGSWGLVFIIPAVVFIFVWVLLVPQGYNVWGLEFVNDLSNVMWKSIGFLFGLSIGGFIVDFIFYLIRKKNLEELNEEYFSVELKK